MSTKYFLDQYRFNAGGTYFVPSVTYDNDDLDYTEEHFNVYEIVDPTNKPIGFAYSADDAQKIVDALNRVPVVGPVQETKDA